MAAYGRGGGGWCWKTPGRRSADRAEEEEEEEEEDVVFLCVCLSVSVCVCVSVFGRRGSGVCQAPLFGAAGGKAAAPAPLAGISSRKTKRKEERERERERERENYLFLGWRRARAHNVGSSRPSDARGPCGWGGRRWRGEGPHEHWTNTRLSLSLSFSVCVCVCVCLGGWKGVCVCVCVCVLAGLFRELPTHLQRVGVFFCFPSRWNVSVSGTLVDPVKPRNKMKIFDPPKVAVLPLHSVQHRMISLPNVFSVAVKMIGDTWYTSLMKEHGEEYLILISWVNPVKKKRLQVLELHQKLSFQLHSVQYFFPKSIDNV